MYTAYSSYNVEFIPICILFKNHFETNGIKLISVINSINNSIYIYTLLKIIVLNDLILYMHMLFKNKTKLL